MQNIELKLLSEKRRSTWPASNHFFEPLVTMEDDDLTLQPLHRRHNAFDDDFLDPSRNLLEKHSSYSSSMHQNPHHGSRSATYEQSYYHGEPLRGFDTFYNESHDDMQEKQRVEDLIKDVLQNNLDNLVPVGEEYDESRLPMLESNDPATKNLIQELEENVLDYDQEIEQERRRNEAQGNDQNVSDVRKFSGKLKTLSHNLEKLKSGIKHDGASDKKLGETCRVVWPKQLKKYIQKKIAKEKSQQNKFNPVPHFSKHNLEREDSSLDDSTRDDRDSKKSHKTNSPPKKGDETSNSVLTTTHSTTQPDGPKRRGRKKKTRPENAASEESSKQDPAENKSFQLSQPSLIKRGSSMNTAAPTSASASDAVKRQQRNTTSVYKTKPVQTQASSTVEVDKPKPQRGRPRKYPLKETADGKKVSIMTSANKSASTDLSSKLTPGEQKDGSSLLNSTLKKKRGPKPSSKSDGVKEKGSIAKSSGKKTGVIISLPANIAMSPSIGVPENHILETEAQEKQNIHHSHFDHTQDDRHLQSNYKPLLSMVRSANDEFHGSTAERNDHLKEDSIEYENFQQLFGNEPPARRKFSSVEFNHHPINMMNEEEDEDNINRHFYRNEFESMPFRTDFQLLPEFTSIEPKQNSLLQLAPEHQHQYRHHQQQLQQQLQTPQVQTQLVTVANPEQPVKRKRGRPKKIRPENETPSTTTPKISANVTPKQGEKPRKKIKTKRSLGDEAPDSDPKERIEEAKGKKAKKTEDARNQLSTLQ